MDHIIAVVDLGGSIQVTIEGHLSDLVLILFVYADVVSVVATTRGPAGCGEFIITLADKRKHRSFTAQISRHIHARNIQRYIEVRMARLNT